jgi:DNA polymerase-3 subunit gamma/tau
VCSACTEINEGRFVDLIEVDAASRTKVDETRELLENVQYAPSRGRYKVYLIDEVHMFSNHSFNALLKTLEEPPPHVKFLLATTDPQKLPVTILSRCLQFNLKRLPVEQIRGYLEQVLGEEGIEYDVTALVQISRAADGSMRDALSLLDQAIAYGGGKVGTEEVRTMLGSIEQNHIIDLLKLLTANDGPGLLARIGELAQHSPDFAGVLAELISTLHRIALAQTAPAAIDDGLGDREAIDELAQQMPPEDVQLYYQIGLIGRRDLPLAPEPRGGFEMVLLRMLAFRPAGAGAQPAAGPAAARRPAQTAAATSTTPVSATTPASAAASAPRIAEPAPATTPAAQPAPIPSAAAGNGGSDEWESLVTAMNLSGMLQQLAANCALAQRDGDHFKLTMSPNHKYLLNKSREEGLGQALGQHLGQDITLSIVLEGASSATPAERQQKRADVRQSHAENVIENDPTVQAIMNAFDGQVKPGSIQPID